MNQRQWQEVETIVRKEQERALLHYDKTKYNELSLILDHLQSLAHDKTSSKCYNVGCIVPTHNINHYCWLLSW